MSIRTGLAGLGLALLPLLAACDLTSVEEIESEDVLVVEAYLRPGSGPEVFLYRTLPGPGGSLRVDGATVEIVAVESGSSVELMEASDAAQCASPYEPLPEGREGTCYVGFLWSHSVEPGGTYRLSVTSADGRQLAGTTTVPGDFEVLEPAADSCTLDDARLEIRWTGSAGAWSYQAVASFTGLAEGLAALGVEDPPDELELLGLAIGSDTTITFPNEFGVFDRFSLDRDVALALQEGLPAGASADIVVAAGDENYVNWIRGGNFNPSGPVRVPSIVGDGTGVFGSLNLRRVTILSRSAGHPSCQ